MRYEELFEAIRAAAPAAPAGLEEWVEHVRTRAYATTDADVATLGLDDDAVFEATVAAAVGEGLRRWEAGKRALA